ncbi:MAG: LssY C-terminal domain-containing protein [Vicinamibacterales bacterium]
MHGSWTTMRRVVTAVGLTLGVTLTMRAAETPRVSRDFTLGPGVWTVTDLEVQPGERVVFAAQGTARCPGVESAFGPEGLTRGFRDLLRILPLPQAGRGALLGRIGSPDIALPFLIGAKLDAQPPTGGVLSLGVNRPESDPCSAAFTVHVDVFPPAEADTVRVPTRVDSLAGVDAALFTRVPRRISDQQGNPGDMVNFLIIGTESQMKEVFTAAGWVVVDADVKGALIWAFSSLSMESYLTLPMSQLYLFGRPQDVGWAHAEPIKVAASRHHLRIWRAPFPVNNRAVWIGAATHDIGFERDRRTGGITHKIDPDIDLEREFVEKTLTGTGLVEAFTYVLPDSPLQDATTATGGSFHSDGRVLILQMPDAAPPAGR